MTPKKITMSMFLLALALLSANAPSAAERHSPLVMDRNNVISLSTTHATVKVIVHFYQHRGRHVTCESSNNIYTASGAPLNSIEIYVNGTSLFVPFSVYADLVQPTQFKVKSQRNGFILTISGCDGADSYFADIYFNQKAVYRKKLYSSLVPDKPTADTRYWLRALEEE